MRRRQLEAIVDRLPDFPEPQARWEQYRTPGTIALELILRAADRGDIEDRLVLDLGCGTGPLALAAAIMGAEVVAVDQDQEAVVQGMRAMRDLWPEGEVQWIVARVDRGGLRIPADAVVVMNPPFGAQTRGADAAFLDLALEAGVVYLLHHVVNEKWLVDRAEAADRAVEKMAEVEFPLPARYRHHARKVVDIPVGLYRIQ